jgi:hypothetical protein
MEGEPKKGDMAAQDVAEAIKATVEKFHGKYPDVEVTQTEYESLVTHITILTKGSNMTREREDKIYEEVLGDLRNKGFKVEADSGAPGGFDGSYGDEDYQQADSWRVTKGE